MQDSSYKRDVSSKRDRKVTIVWLTLQHYYVDDRLLYYMQVCCGTVVVPAGLQIACRIINWIIA